MPTATGASSLNAFTTFAPLRSPIALAASHARRFHSLEGALAKTKRHLVEGGTLYAISDVKLTSIAHNAPPFTAVPKRPGWDRCSKKGGVPTSKRGTEQSLDCI